MNRMTKEIKDIIISRQHTISELSKLTGVSSNSIRNFCSRHNISLPRSNKSYMDLTGKRFGLLLVLYRKWDDERGIFLWVCKCDCGNTHSVQTGSLRNGGTISCGCFVKSNNSKIQRHADGLASARMVYRHYINNARRRNILFELSLDEFISIAKKNCAYCGRVANNKSKPGNAATPFIYSGIDRYDNTQGYTTINCVPCCSKCNYLKSNMAPTEFYELIKAIYEHSTEWFRSNSVYRSAG